MKVSELSGALLDYWVAKAEACEVRLISGTCEARIHPDFGFAPCNPSTSWAQAGPIIAREGISISPPESPVHRHGGPHAGWGDSGLWSSTIFRRGPHRRTVAFHESEPLVAAMRVFVASRFGAEVPDEVTA